MTACYIAALLGSARLVRQYIHQLHVRCDVYRDTCLHAAIAHNHLQAARVLLRHGADPLAQDDRGITPIHHAVHNGSLVLTILLLQHCTKLPADLVWYCNNCDVYDLLMENKMDVLQFNFISRAMTPLHMLALRQQPDVDLVQALWPVFGEMENFCGETAEHLAYDSANFNFLCAIHAAHLAGQ